VTHLEKQRPVSEGGTTLDTFGAADAERFVNRVLEVRVLYKDTLYRSGRAKLILGTRIPRCRLGLKIARAEITISAYLIKLNALDGRFFQHAIGGTVSTRCACVRIDLPYSARFSFLVGCRPGYHSQGGQASSPQTVFHEMTPVDCLVIF
jgi:hypothetical protein